MTHVFMVGLILLLALIGGHLVKLIRVPEVVGYFFIGLLLGPSVSRILTRDIVTGLEVFAEIALGLILFSIGAIFEFDNLRRLGRQTLIITGFVMAGTLVTVFAALLAMNGSWQVPLLLAVIATEISPIATILVLREANAEGPLTDAVFNLLAVNNVGCLVVFGLATFLVRVLGGESVSPVSQAVATELLEFLWGVIGSVALGVALGYILAIWGRRIDEHGEVLILVLGMILIAVGASHWLGLSSLIATMALGATLINLSQESRHLFEVLGKTDPPLYAIFFVLAGAHLQLSSLLAIGVSGIGYTVARIIGKVVGAFFGARRAGYSATIGKYLGWTLVPHAGVAIGLALQTRTILPEYGDAISAVILGSVLINEVLGPVLTKLAISKSGEARVERAGAFEVI